MKKIVFISLFILSTMSLSTQALMHEGAEWYIDYQFGKSIGDIGYAHLEYAGDTIINDTIAHILTSDVFNVSYNIDHQTEYLTQYIFSTEDEVYRFHDGHFRLAYDLNAEVGDVYTNYAPHCNFGNNQSVVDSVGVININGLDLRFILLSQVEVDDVNIAFKGIIIERIGTIPVPDFHSEYFLPQHTCWDDGEYYVKVRCYSDHTFSVESEDVFGDCDYSTVGINELITTINVDVFPNPSAGIFMVNTAKISIEAMELYNEMGQHLFTVNDVGLREQELDLRSFKRGIYFLKIIGEDGLYGYRKLVRV